MAELCRGRSRGAAAGRRAAARSLPLSDPGDAGVARSEALDPDGPLGTCALRVGLGAPGLRTDAGRSEKSATHRGHARARRLRALKRALLRNHSSRADGAPTIAHRTKIRISSPRL